MKEIKSLEEYNKTNLVFELINLDNIEDKTKYINKLDQLGWDNFFENYFSIDENSLFRNESIHSYVLIILERALEEDTNIYIKELIYNTLIKNFIDSLNNNNFKNLKYIFDIVDYLEFSIDIKYLFEIITNCNFNEDLKMMAAISLNTNYNRPLINFWNKIDLSNNLFLIPYYISFFETINPFEAIEKLSLINDIPRNIAEFEIPVKNSLYNIQQSSLYINKLNNFLITSPSWKNQYLDEIITSYPELNLLKEKLKHNKSNPQIKSQLSENFEIKIQKNNTAE